MMQLTKIKPVDYLRDHIDELLTELDQGGAPLVITQGGEAKAVLQSARDYERTQDTLALLKIIALAERNITTGQTRPARDVIEEVRIGLQARRAAE